MGLQKYKQKRSFDITSEPTGGKSKSGNLTFVIQKHAASHLHYDFRLEMDGVLKSWAVPKGPSTDPEIKRLAMMVEDHPYDYRKFEGIIPQGQYGGGTVIVWDEGTYEAAEMPEGSKKEQEKHLLHSLHAGKIKFNMHGEKLKGEYALVKAHGRGENGWLLMKLEDKYASTKDVTKKDKSVLSGLDIDEVAATTTNIYGKKKASTRPKNDVGTNTQKDIKPNKTSKPKSPTTVKKTTIRNGVKAKFPKDILPMLATLVDKPFNREDWLYEVKWDGYRALALSNVGKVDLKSRNNKSFNEKFYPIYDAVRKLNIEVVLDGEIVVINDKGLPDFGMLQNWRSEVDGTLKYYVFDILWLDGKDLTNLPLTERRKILIGHLQENEFIQISQVFDNTNLTFFESAKDLGLEGIMAKRKDSIYLSGDRTNDWLKMKSGKRQEVIIAGYTNNDGSNKPFSALLVGVYEKGKLHFIGKIGTGFNIKEQKEMLVQFAPLIISKPAFQEIPDIDKPSRFRPNPPKATVTWLKPKLVCEVTYNEITSDGVMRHPSFKGMRIDKPAKDIVEEKPVAIDTKTKSQKKSIKEKIVAVPKKSRKTLLNPTDETQVKNVNGHDLKFTNLSKVFWPDDNVIKRDLINYYYQMAPYILPYLKDRPQSLNRHPHGINGENFYQKDVTGKAPEWIDTFLYHSEADSRDRHFLVATDEASLLYMASLGCIEMNPWNSRVQTPDNPDWCIIDLDPDKNTFDQVIQAAQVTKQILDDMNVPCYCKTSGSTGIHIYIPLGAKYSYEQSKEFARVIATLVHNELPKFTSIERKTANRGGKMYIDFLQNRPQATIAAPYSLRPKPGATVSMPLHWDEVKKGLKMKDFTIFNAAERVAETGDLFKPVIGKGIDLLKVVGSWQDK